MTKLDENEGAIIFSENGMRLLLPEMDEDDYVPQHLLDGVYAYMLLTERRGDIQLLIDEIAEEMGGEDE